MIDMRMNIILLFGAVLGLSSIIMAAYVDHSLALHLNGKSLGEVLIGVRYHQLYAVVVSVIGLFLPLQINNRVKSWLTRSACIFFMGALLFSLGIYLSAILSFFWMAYLIPVGGILLMLGWACLIRSALLKM
jgi:uncharacterized membrane protein YgdD (TMEM256/DUF423 family)